MTRDKEVVIAAGADRRNEIGGTRSDRDQDVLSLVESESRFGRYELLLEMARGGMATLYLARLRGPEQFEKLVALKQVHDHYSTEATFTDMFLDEARLTARIQHPNVAAVFDMGQVEHRFFIAMEYVHGESFNEVIKAAIRQDIGLGWHHAMRIVADAAAGLHAAHELTSTSGEPFGVVHRDVSPQNLLVSYDGHVKVVDFGIAYAAERLSSTATGTVKGKAAYMSPEQVAAGAVDRRSDIFSLGIVLWEALTGRRLFRAESDAATLLRIRDGDVPNPGQYLPQLPGSVEHIVMTALEYDPRDRYQTAGELAEALKKELIRQDRFLGAPQLAEMMGQLFTERRREKDERIQQALLRKATRTEPEPELETSVDQPSQTGLSISSAIHRKPIRSLPLAIVGGLVAVGLLVVLGMLLLPGDRDGDTSSEKTEKGVANPMQMTGTPPKATMHRRVTGGARSAGGGPAMTARQPLKMVTVRVTIKPEYSKPVVSFRGRKYQGAQFRVAVPREQKETLLEIDAPGFKKENLIVSLAQDARMSVTLRRKPRPRRYRIGRPRPRPMAADLVKTY